MAQRIIEMHRVLKEVGSLYLHCDSTASHYLKSLLDGIFGKRAFVNEIIWHYTGNSVPKYCLPRKHDTIYWYCKGKRPVFFPKNILFVLSDIDFSILL
jgi:site-specific DNA-methyltransferase (adenine-specific)